MQSPPLLSQPPAVRTVSGFRQGIPKHQFFSPKYVYFRKAPFINEFQGIPDPKEEVLHG